MLTFALNVSHWRAGHSLLVTRAGGNLRRTEELTVWDVGICDDGCWRATAGGSARWGGGCWYTCTEGAVCTLMSGLGVVPGKVPVCFALKIVQRLMRCQQHGPTAPYRV